MTLRGKACDNPDCSVSYGICGRLTFGCGKLDSHGYWEKPCYTCARNHELCQYKDTGVHFESAWPPMTGKDFFQLCRNATTFSTFIANVGNSIVEYNQDYFWACAGYAVLAKKGQVIFAKIQGNLVMRSFVEKVIKIMDEHNWHIANWPGEVYE